MFFAKRQVWLRLGLATVAASLLGVGYWRDRSGSRFVQAAPENDPNVVWTIGKTDNSSDEFGAGAARSLTYTIGRSSPSRDWRQRQDSAESGAPVWKVRFRLDQAPPSPVIALDCFYLGASPQSIELNVNGKRGLFRIRPAGGPDLDGRQANNITHSRQSFRMPVDPSYLRQGENELAISFAGDGGSVYYDSLALLRNGAGTADLSATVEPTIFYRRNGEQLKELTEVLLHHRQPAGKASVNLKVGEAAISRESADDGYDFGERIIEVEVPAMSAPRPYTLQITAGGKSSKFQGEFRPEKRWRIFAGLKIHNDIGYTDLQPHVQELDNRNTDGVIDIIAREPFYKFNFETGWLVDNFMSSRKPARVKQLMALAARDRVGINAIYLNLMTGMCTGEELYRSLYFSKGLQRKYGIPLKFACLTDAPSHTWFVPTLLADSGVKGFANGSNQTRAPLLQNSNLNEESPFWWQGPDGSKVLAWFARSYLQLDRLAGARPNLAHLRRTVSQFLARYRRGNYPVDAVLLYGLFSDNADIRRGDAEVLKEWNAAWAFPRISPATDADYYAYLAEHFANKLPVFKGDAGSYWEDGSGSTAAETAINRDTQRLLPITEMAGAFATLFHPGEVYPAAEFRDVWKNVLFYDEHTWGASRSIAQPDRQLVTDQWEFKRAYAMRAHWAAKDLLYRSFNRLVQNITVEGPSMFVFNPDIWPRTDVVQIELEPGRNLFDLATGAEVPVEEISRKDNYRVLRFMAERVPGLGYKAYTVRSGNAVPAPPNPDTSSWRIESRFYRVMFDPATGAIAELYDKELGRNLVDRQASYKANELLYVSGGEKSRILQDNVTLQPATLEITGQSLARVVANTGKRMVVRAQSKNVPEIETEVVVYDNIKRVDIVNRLRKESTRAKEAVYFAFPFAVSPPELAYQIQNAWVRPNADQLPGACREWFTTQNLVIARDAGATIAWSTPDAPLITLTDINRGYWLKHLDIKNGYVFSYSMNNYWFTNYKAAQGGDYTCRYFITSAKSLSPAELARFDAETRSPLVGYAYYDTGNVRQIVRQARMPLAGGAFLQIDAVNAQVTAFKEAEDGNGYILRLRETAGQQGVARLVSPVFPVAGAQRCNGVEDIIAPLKLNASGAIDIPLKPWQFSTVRLLFARQALTQARTR